MVILEKTKKTLVIPSGLGNKATGSGGISPEAVQEIVDASVNTYDEETVQPQFDVVDGRLDALEAATGGSKTAYILDEMSNDERQAMYDTLLELVGHSGAVNPGQDNSAATVNDKYEFYYTYSENRVCYRLQYCGFSSNNVFFCAAVGANNPELGTISILKIAVHNDGSLSHRSISDFTLTNKGTATVGYFDNFSNYPVYNKATSTFTDKDGNALNNGGGFGGSVYWFIFRPIEGDWGNGIPTLPFKVIDNGVGKMYYYPTVSVETLENPVTIDGVEYNEIFTCDYGSFSFSGYLNSTPQYANLTYTE